MCTHVNSMHRTYALTMRYQNCVIICTHAIRREKYNTPYTTKITEEVPDLYVSRFFKSHYTKRTASILRITNQHVHVVSVVHTAPLCPLKVPALSPLSDHHRLTWLSFPQVIKKSPSLVNLQKKTHRIPQSHPSPNLTYTIYDHPPPQNSSITRVTLPPHLSFIVSARKRLGTNHQKIQSRTTRSIYPVS